MTRPSTNARFTWRPRVRRVVATVAIASLAAACGGGDDDEASSTTVPLGPPDLTVVAGSFDFDRDAYMAKAGALTIAYVNDDALPHTLAIKGVKGFRAETGPKKDDAAAASLKPGKYVLFCDIAGHEAAGMKATLTVT